MTAERPPLPGTGRVVAERKPGHLYDVVMPNGHRAVAVVPLDGPRPPESEPVIGKTVELAFSPYDMSRCRVVSWAPA